MIQKLQKLLNIGALVGALTLGGCAARTNEPFRTAEELGWRNVQVLDSDPELKYDRFSRPELNYEGDPGEHYVCMSEDIGFQIIGEHLVDRRMGPGQKWMTMMEYFCCPPETSRGCYYGL